MYKQFIEKYSGSAWHGELDDFYGMGYFCGERLEKVDSAHGQQWQRDQWYMGYRDALGDLGFHALAQAHLEGAPPEDLVSLLQDARSRPLAATEEGGGPACV